MRVGDAVRSIIGFPNASVCPSRRVPGEDVDRGGVGQDKRLDGERRPDAEPRERLDHGALAPSAVNDWIIWRFLPCEARCDTRETRNACNQEEREVGSLGV